MSFRKKTCKLAAVALLLALGATFLVPLASDARPRRSRAGQGCWVRIWKDNHHKGWYALIRGPRHLTNLKIGNRYWGDRITGLSTGPRTWVKVFKDQGFHGGVLIIPPNTNYGSLKTVSFNDDIDSMIIQNKPFR
jgi:hypothetical protein